jgi:hypothetical protein
MSAAASLRVLVERYLRERRRLGFGLVGTDSALRSFARHVQAIDHHGPLTVEVMADWARCDSRASTDPHTWARRLKKLRSFMRWLQQFDPRTEVPDDTIFGRLPERLAPHIYSERELVELLGAAAQLGPAPGLRGPCDGDQHVLVPLGSTGVDGTGGRPLRVVPAAAGDGL